MSVNPSLESVPNKTDTSPAISFRHPDAGTQIFVLPPIEWGPCRCDEGVRSGKRCNREKTHCSDVKGKCPIGACFSVTTAITSSATQPSRPITTFRHNATNLPVVTSQQPSSPTTSRQPVTEQVIFTTFTTKERTGTAITSAATQPSRPVTTSRHSITTSSVVTTQQPSSPTSSQKPVTEQVTFPKLTTKVETGTGTTDSGAVTPTPVTEASNSSVILSGALGGVALILLVILLIVVIIFRKKSRSKGAKKDSPSCLSCFQSNGSGTMSNPTYFPPEIIQSHPDSNTGNSPTNNAMYSGDTTPYYNTDAPNHIYETVYTIPRRTTSEDLPQPAAAYSEPHGGFRQVNISPRDTDAGYSHYEGPNHEYLELDDGGHNKLGDVRSSEPLDPHDRGYDSANSPSSIVNNNNNYHILNPQGAAYDSLNSPSGIMTNNNDYHVLDERYVNLL